MELNTNSSHPWLPMGEQDFHLGARATSCLPSATVTELNYGSNDLPEWMENRDTLSFSTSALFNNPPGHNEIDSLQIINQQFDVDEDYSIAIKPDDMLVPLSELQPEGHTPQGLGVCPLPEKPKVTIRVNKFKVSTPVQPRDNSNVSAFQNTPQNMLPSQNYSANMELVQPMEDQLDFDAAELLNELSNLPQKNPNGLSEMFSLLDSSVVEGALNDLLSHLESDDANQDTLSNPQENTGLVSSTYVQQQQQTEILSPVCIPSPVPSMGNQSPQSTEQSFYLSPNSYIVNEVYQPEENNGISFSSLVSPCKTESSVSSPALEESSFSFHMDEDDVSVLSSVDDDSFSVTSPITVDSFSVVSPITVDKDVPVDNCSKSDLHSYSRSPNKKSSRKGSTRPYPEGRKERKKEQNKQAALRYRQKKKVEDDKIMMQIKVEEERQQKLKLKYGNLKQELSYLKKLMREVLIAKGTLSPEAFKK